MRLTQQLKAGLSSRQKLHELSPHIKIHPVPSPRRPLLPAPAPATFVRRQLSWQVSARELFWNATKAACDPKRRRAASEIRPHLATAESHTLAPKMAERLTFLTAVAAVVVVADDAVNVAAAVDAVLVAAARVNVAADVEVAGFGFLSATATAGTV